VNQTDQVLISNRFRSAITDIRAPRGPNIESYHNLLKINFKVKLRVKTGNKYEGKSISKLQIQVATYVFELSAGNCQC